MKTAALFLAAAAATLAAAEPQKAMPSGTKINCARPNGSYCMGDDTILKCDGNAEGMPMKCADDIMAMSPSAKGGAATCRESSKEAGDAACMKNCVVYASPSKYTLGPDQCTPSSPASSAPGASSAPASSPTSPNGCPAPSKPASSAPMSSAPQSSIPVTSPYSSSPKSNMPSSTGPVTVPTGAAASNNAAGGLAFAGMIAAYFL
ncbi:hypothetical protein VHEMI10180 [[Torrubiella] hemipterigena]|uniref:Uncharacterized protein n=1 Tax=[Torrubiella] hemipterigena TaxID=1531966 RepID=A0A0A1TRS5_9HYPO|nr:hypothetical protein VHEMI10180 [[Torrubiella] hemipterigena]